MKKSLMLKSLIILLFSIFSIIILTNNVEASTVGLTATATEVTIGQQVTVTASVTAGAWNLSLAGANQTKGLVGQTTTTDNSSSSTSITFTPTTSGNYKFTLTGDMTDYITDVTDTVNKSITITVKAKETTQQPATGNESNNNTQTQTQPPATTTPTKSSEARLKNFGIKPNDFSGFKKDKTEYTTEVPNDVAEVEVYAEAADSKATVKGTGKVSLKEGNNTAKVTVTAEDGKTTKTYTITIKRKTAAEEEEETGEARLSQLGIKPDKYDFSGFKSDQTEYSVEVPNEVEEIEVYAKAMDSKAQITGTGMIELKEGENELKIEVIAQNGTKQTYTINVTRKEAKETVVEKFGLSNLSIKGFNLTPSFMTGTYEYTVELTEDLSSLEIEAKATDKGATVEIVGNENLQEGENTITILVQNEDTKESATYQITVNKNLQKEVVMQTSWLKPSTWGKEEKIKIAIIILLIILIISAIVLKVKMAKENEPKNKLDLPGADELDKAITEHQELVGEEFAGEKETPNEQIEGNQIESNELKQNYIEQIARNTYAIEDDFQEKTKRRKGKH